VTVARSRGDASGKTPPGAYQEPADGAVREREAAAEVIGLLTERGQHIAVAESLTGGLLAAALTGIPGASAAFRGAVVAYATELKATILGVPAGLLERHGAVHPDVAAEMAAGVRRQLGAAVGAATTGVAGPDPADGQPVGTVYIAVSIGPAAAGPGSTVRSLALRGSRDQIRRETVTQCLRLLLTALREDSA
jgi:nicotinamide-nucleotide amidase